MRKLIWSIDICVNMNNTYDNIHYAYGDKDYLHKDFNRFWSISANTDLDNWKWYNFNNMWRIALPSTLSQDEIKWIANSINKYGRKKVGFDLIGDTLIPSSLENHTKMVLANNYKQYYW